MLARLDCPVCGCVLPCVGVDAVTRLDGDALVVEFRPRFTADWFKAARRIHGSCYGRLDDVSAEVIP